MLGWLLLIWMSVVALVLTHFRRDIRVLWREPVLRRPVLIVESDDWGPGPPDQAEALGEIIDLFVGFRDRDGRHPVFTLSVVLATSAGPESSDGYTPLFLDDGRYDPLRQIMKRGQAQGITPIQLHGREHYWPFALVAAAARDVGVADWLCRRAPEAGTEALPSHLQSRWTDASSLPSTPLAPAAIAAATADEVACFERIFGVLPRVVVPPTFVWNPEAEQGWFAAGIRCLITPGRRFDSRGADGRPVAVAGTLRNGQRSPAGLLYLVRDDYFEPMRGHRAERALDALARKTRLARPTLLETHRSNFLDPESRRISLEELRRLLSNAVAAYPGLAFIDPSALSRILDSGAPDWIENRWAARLAVVLDRLDEVPRFRKLSLLTGLAALLSLVRRWSRWAAPRTERPMSARGAF